MQKIKINSSQIMIEGALQKLDLSAKEASIYINLLKLGSAPIRTIAAAANINRTTTHDIVRQLCELGLVSFVDKEKHRYFAAQSPEHLLNVVEQKKNQLDKTHKDIKNLLPELKSLYEKSDSKPRVKYFEGDVGVRAILQDVLHCTNNTPHKRYYVYSSSTIRDTLVRVFPKYSDQRIKLGIRVQSISIGKGGTLIGLDERKWLSKDEGAPTYTLLYAGKVAVISLQDYKEPLGVVIEDNNTYETQVMIFKNLWEKLG
jgi:HTH-type transcriptional regulator, sugar sensing transcriptional regulator